MTNPSHFRRSQCSPWNIHRDGAGPSLEKPTGGNVTVRFVPPAPQDSFGPVVISQDITSGNSARFGSKVALPSPMVIENSAGLASGSCSAQCRHSVAKVGSSLATDRKSVV